MTQEQELELIKTVRAMSRQLRELQDLIKPAQIPDDELLDFKGAVGFLKISESYLRKLVADGTIPFSRKGRRLRFSRNSLLNWVNG